jgi:hypothetical protein
MSKCADIIARLEAATGPDREIDYLIYDFEMQKAGLETRLADLLPHWTEEQRRSTLALYTDSLDAAIGLVERMLPGCDWLCRSGGRTLDGGAFFANIQPTPLRGGDEWIDGETTFPAWAVSAPHALILSMFRAIEAQAVQP